MTEPVYQLSAGVKNETAQLALEEPRSVGAVAVVGAKSPSPLTSDTYARAVTLVEQLSTSIARVTSRKGPSARLNPIDAWLLPKENTRLLGACVSGFAATCGGLVAAMAMCTDGPWSAVLVCSGIAAGLGGLSYLFAGCEKRVEAARTRHAAEKLDSRDVKGMLGPYVAALPQERAALRSFAEGQLADLDRIMSPQAAITRDEVLAAQLQPTEPRPELQRGVAVAAAIHRLIGGQVPSRGAIEAIEGTNDEASPNERRQIAAVMRQRLFKGEHPIFDAPQNEQRQLYAIMQRAARGEPSTELPQE